MDVIRIISVYEKDGDKLIEEISIDEIPFDVLKEIVKIAKDDPNFYKPYLVSHRHYKRMVSLIPKLSEFPISKFELYFECFQE